MSNGIATLSTASTPSWPQDLSSKLSSAHGRCKTQSLADLGRTWVPSSSDPKLLLSVLSHVAEIYPASLAEAVVPDAPLSSSTELDAIPAPSTSKPRTAPLPILDLMQPAIQSLCQATQKSHFAAVFDHLLEPLLLACDNIAPPSQKNKRRKLDDDDAHFAQVLQQSPLCDTEGAPLAPEDVESKLLSVIFEAASQPTVSVANRRRLYALCRERMPDEEAPAEEA